MKLLFILGLLLHSFSLDSVRTDLCSDDNIHVETIFEIGTVQSLMISREGDLLSEYFRGNMSADRKVNIKSASKSILSLLIGIAIDHGYIDGVHVTLGAFFPGYFAQYPDPVKESITLMDLLTMRSGLETTSFRNYGRWVLSNNWTEYAISQPLITDPGSRMVYSTGTSHLLSVILTNATEMSTRAFADRYLFGPLGIRAGGWDRDPQGFYMGGNNMALSPADLIKIGELMMDTGVYKGERIVSRKWVLESTRIYTQSNFNPYNYGYMWWRKNVSGTEVFFAWGNGGQYIFMLPDYDSVISVTSALRSGGSRNYQREIFTYLENTLLPYLSCIEKI
ncbi:MAG: class C beta-lactamase-related serine hydrolase [Balneolaceae bacterium]|nr:MAG: class C beta-lactamase-related serine hydrolase [Balneolaceae bacterium]